MVKCVITLFLWGLLSCALAAQKITIGLDWFINPHHALLIVAQEKGFFAEEGLDVTLVPAGGSLEACKQVGAKTLDFAVTLEPQLYLQQSKGLPIRLATVLIHEPLEVMVSRVPIQELSDKTIGHCSSGIGFSIMAAKRIFQHNGLREPENFLYIKNGLLTALLAGQVDAVINIYKTYNLLDIEKYKGTKNFYVYPYGDNGVPSFASLILVANTHTPIPHIDALNRALKRACVYFQNNLDETWQLFIRKYPENNTELNRRVWWLLAPLFHVTPFQDHVENKPLKDFLESEHAA